MNFVHIKNDDGLDVRTVLLFEACLPRSKNLVYPNQHDALITPSNLWNLPEPVIRVGGELFGLDTSARLAFEDDKRLQLVSIQSDGCVEGGTCFHGSMRRVLREL